jgi:hypothetical protein
MCLPQLHIVAIHAESQYKTEVPGLAVLCTKDNRVVSIGVYQNSLGGQSSYAVAGTYLGNIGKVKYGIVVGTVDGYPLNNGNFIPMAAAIATIHFKEFNVHLTMVPSVPNYTPAFIQISVTFGDLK